MRSFLLELALVLMCLGSPAHLLLATDYHVSGAGSDTTGDGSAGNPWRTISRAMAAVAAPGDRILVGAGTYDQAAGEAFPVVLQDGVEVAGPGDGSAVVDSVASGLRTFEVGSLASLTVVSGLVVNAPTTGGPNNARAFRINGAPADLRIVGNTITGLTGISNGGASGVAGPARLTVQGNTITSGAPVIWRALSQSVAHEVLVTGNTITTTGKGSPGVEILARSNATVSALVSSNLVVGSPTDDGILVGAAGANATVGGSVAGNLVSSAQDGIRGMADGDGASLDGQATISLEIRGNTVSGCLNGIYLNAQATATGAAGGFSGMVECNTIVGATSFGLLGSAVGNLGLSALFDPQIRFNEVMTCSRGIGLFAIGFSGASAACRPELRGNLSMGNADDGVALGLAMGAGGTAALEPDFGGSAPADLGRNTIRANAGFDFDLTSVVASATIAAEGNWLSGTTSVAVEAAVNHRVDHPTLALLDFQPFLLDPLVFSANPSTLSTAGGEMVTLMAAAGTPFLEKAGSRSLTVTLDGIPVLNLSVSADGGTLSFTTPAGLTAGNKPLAVTNPGGQLGVLLIALTGGSGPPPAGGGGGGGGFCFVATAAYGDAEAPEVRLLRRWRDECLAGQPLGRAVVRAYYALSPPLAEAVSQSALARAASRAALAPVVGAVRVWLELPWLYGLAVALLLWSRLRRGRRGAFPLWHNDLG